MKVILYIVAIVASCGAAFFSFQHKNKFEALEADRLGTIAANESVSSEADVAEKNIKEEQGKLAAAKDRRDLLTQSVSSLRSAGSSLENENKNLDADIKVVDAELTQLAKAPEELNKILEGTGGGVTLDNLAEKVEEVIKDREDKQKKFDELEILTGAAQKSLASNRSELDRLGKRMTQRNSRINRNAMQAVVTAVNQEWGFLVIGAGSNSGFTPQTSLIVERNGRKIGLVRPSSIEPTQTIAEIDFESLASGVRLQPGDRVILTKPTGN